MEFKKVENRRRIRQEELAKVLIRQSQGKLKEDLLRDATGPQSLDSLTRREREIVESLLDAGSVTAVASSLHISLHTVRNHLKSIFRKLGVHSQVELVASLCRLGDGSSSSKTTEECEHD